MSQGRLFGNIDEPVGAVVREPRATRCAPRLVLPDRCQVRMGPHRLEDLLEPGHPARRLDQAVGKLDLSEFYEEVGSRADSAGRPAIDPRMLLTLWLFATREGVGSARELARLCQRHDAYRWICGGIEVNHHTLSDFRVGHGKKLDELLTQVLAVLMHHGVLRLRRVAQDGMKVRAHAGKASFRRKKTLRESLKLAKKQVRRLKSVIDRPDAEPVARKQAAKKRAALEAQARLERALEELPKVVASKETEEAREHARVSTTDPEARVMKMADGGYRPAYNIQLATDTETRVIVGARVTNSGGDMGQIEPTLVEMQERTNVLPRDLLVDGGYAKKQSIEYASASRVTVYAPVPHSKVAVLDPYEPKPKESAALGQWRLRMKTEKAKKIYKERASTAELTNAHMRSHYGLQPFNVRGLQKVLSVTLWSVLVYDLMQWLASEAWVS